MLGAKCGLLSRPGGFGRLAGAGGGGLGGMGGLDPSALLGGGGAIAVRRDSAKQKSRKAGKRKQARKARKKNRKR
jgi:hypothetical protein